MDDYIAGLVLVWVGEGMRVRTRCGREFNSDIGARGAHVLVVRKGWKKTWSAVKACPCDYSFRPADGQEIWMCELEEADDNLSRGLRG